VKELRCNATGCDRVVLVHHPRDFGLAIVFCVEHARAMIAGGFLAQLAGIGFTGEANVHPSREDA
jgi:hypothetical protein